MRLKRILQRMSDWMRGRGVGLLVVALGAMLSSEMAKGAPASVGKCAVGALKLAGESPIGFSSVLRSPKMTTAGVIALTIGTAIPATKMWSEIRDLREQREALSVSNTNLVSQRTGARTRTVRDAVRSLSGDKMKQLSMEGLAMQVVLANERDDILAQHKIGLVLAEMEFEESKDLLRALFALPIEDQRKVNAESDLKFYNDKLYPKGWRGRDEIEFSIAHEAPAKLVGYKYGNWIDSSAGMGQAIAWFEENRETGLLDGPKGTR